MAPGDVAVWRPYTHKRLMNYVSEAIEQFTKAQLLDQLKPLPKGLVGHVEVGPFKA